MNPVNETAADKHDPGRYAARFAQQTWLGLAHVASGLDAAVVSFTLSTDAGGHIQAEAVVRAGERDVQYATVLDPSPSGPPVDIAVALFVTAVEERLLSPGFKNPATQLALAAARVTHRRNAIHYSGGPDVGLASALYFHASLLMRQGHPEHALPLLDEAIDHYTELAATEDNDRFRSDLQRAVALREQCRPDPTAPV